MTIHHNLPRVEEILGSFRETIGADFTAYRNHVYRMANLCLAESHGAEEQEKIEIAAAFHDIGIWTAGTLDYLPPSEEAAARYLAASGRDAWIPEITAMIAQHHRVRDCDDFPYPLVERFRRADIADFSLGVIRMGHPRERIAALKQAFPNAGFHQRLLQLGSRWVLRHPLNPLPMFRR